MNSNERELVQTKGTIERTGITTYMYGEYKLVESAKNIVYALRSSTLDLSKYVGQHVEVTGTKISGYPLDGGPVYLDIETVVVEK